MNDFTASNGTQVQAHPNGYISTRRNSEPFEALEGWEAQALREFFQAEADERLGRWRWPENPDYVVYLRENGSVTVVEESMPTAALTFWKNLGATGTSSGKYMAAARAYFDAHPEPKPWHEAKPGEVWIVGSSVVTWEGDQPMIVNEDGEFQNYTWTFLVNDHEITHARRIWPEVSS